MRSGPVRLTWFHGCGEELAALRKAAEASVEPLRPPGSGLVGERRCVPGSGRPGHHGPRPGHAAARGRSAGVFRYERLYGRRRRDLVKTDGRRIVTVADGVLEVIDAASRTVTGRLDLSAAGGDIAYRRRACC